MIVDIYYSTIGLLLDIIMITLPVLIYFKCAVKNRVKTYVVLLLTTYILLALNLGNIPQYLLIFSVILLVMYFVSKVEYMKLFMYVSYFTLLVTFDYIAISNFNDLNLLVFSTMYKIIFIILNRVYIEIDHELKEKILSGACVSVIIILSIIIGGIKHGH